MRHIFIINPAAGKNSPARGLIPAIKAAFFERNDDYEIYETRGHRDAIGFVRDSCARYQNQPLRFYACGGDGTVNEVVNAMADYPHASFGVVPCGSGNDFIKSVPGNANFLSIEAQLAGHEQPIDLMKVNDRYCVNLSNIGFDADVAANMERFKTLPLVTGKAAYNLSILYCFFSKMGNHLKVVVDGSRTLTSNFLLMVAANGGFYGGAYRGAPAAKIDDGLIDLCAVHKISRFQIAKLIAAYKAGKHVDNPAFANIVEYYKCQRIEVFADRPVSLCIDGECFYDSHIVFELEPNRVLFSLPAPVSKQDDPASARLAKV